MNLGDGPFQEVFESFEVDKRQAKELLGWLNSTFLYGSFEKLPVPFEGLLVILGTRFGVDAR